MIDRAYRTYEEIAFVRGLKPEAFTKYAEVVKSGMRAFDSTVDRTKVIAEIERIQRGEVEG